MSADAIELFRAAMRSHGLDYAGPIAADGALHRIKAEGDHARNSWYVLHSGPPMAGAFGCWKRGVNETWCAGNGRMSDPDFRAAKSVWKQAEAERKRVEESRHAAARRIAASIIRQSREADSLHGYLVRKGVEPVDGLRVHQGRLVVPLRDADGVLHSLQTITPDGTKRFLTGGRIAGTFLKIDGPPDKPLCICEGVSSGLSVHSATSFETWCAMNCGNLKAVAQSARGKFGDRLYIIAGDDDKETAGNPGRTAAEEAAKAVNGVVAFPKFEDGQAGSDFNDLQLAAGPEAVHAQLSESMRNYSPAKKETSSGSRMEKSAASELIELTKGIVFFHAPDDEAFACIEVKGHIENWRVNSKRFKTWLAGKYYREHKAAANRNSVGDAILALESKSRFEGEQRDVFLRVAPADDGGVLLDLCDGEWRVVHISCDGWRVLDQSPVAFIRTKDMRPLPMPGKNTSLDPLWELLNVTEAQRVLAAGWLMSALNPLGPYFVGVLVGEQGTGKSTAARILRSLIDPSAVPLRSPPRDERDLIVGAASNWVCTIDNLSTLSPWLSDALCRVATEGGLSARQLYTDGEEFTLDIKRPTILNGIERVATRPDLAERSLEIELEPVADDKRITEAELWQKFDNAHPTILGGLLNGVAAAIRNSGSVTVQLPRMADATRWTIAGETALGFAEGEFLKTYQVHSDHSAITCIESSVIGDPLLTLLRDRTEWTGSTKELLAALNHLIGEATPKGWPASPRKLSDLLTRIAPPLRRMGFDLIRHDRTSNSRLITLCKTCKTSSRPSQPSSEPEYQGVTQEPTSSQHRHGPSHIVTGKPPKTLGNDGHDGHDDVLQPVHDADQEGDLLI